MTKLKRYLTFAYDMYYPGGGWADFQGSFDLLEEAGEHLKNLDFYHDRHRIIDSETGEEIYGDWD